MKKALPIVLAILVVVAASIWWVLRGAGVSDAALLVPAETVAFASLPDIPRSGLRWPQTTLAKIGAEQAVKDFLEKPLQSLNGPKGRNDAGEVLWKLKPGRIFFAAPSVSAEEGGLLVGFQFWGGKPGHDLAVQHLRDALAAGGPAPEVRHESHNGIEISHATYGALTLYNASVGHWGFLSNSLPAIKDALDRASGQRTDGSLADSPRYKQVMGHMQKDPDFIFFAQPQSFIDLLLKAGQNFGAQQIEKQVAQARAVEAIGATMKMDGADLRDNIFVLRPNPPDVGTLTHKGIALTTPDTTAFVDFVTNFRQLFEVGANPAAGAIAGSKMVMDSKLPQLVPEAFGPECAVSLSWPEGAFKPEGVLAVEVRDPAKAQQCLDEVASLFPETKISEQNGVRYHSFPSLGNPLLNPTIALHGDFLLVGMAAAEMDRFLSGLKKGATLESSPSFASSLPTYKSANEVFGFVDARAVFERGYPSLSQILRFGAAVTGSFEFMDVSKLPETEVIAKHLSPIVYAQQRLSDGYFVESSGPVTMNHALLFGAGVGAVLGRSALTTQ